MQSEQKAAIVTGGSSGLGLAITKKFISNHVHTVIIGRDERKLKAAQKDLGNLCSYYVFDLANLDKIPALVKKIFQENKNIDILVNNAGVHLKKTFTEVTDQEFQEVVLVNLTSVFIMSREVSKFFLKKGSGSILNISSMAARYGLPQVIAYTASKSGIEGMTRAMAVELSPRGIRVNCIAPGFITTNMSSLALNNDPERKSRVISRTPMGKLGTPTDIGDAAYFLVSDAAKYITGITLPVDGGNSIGF